MRSLVWIQRADTLIYLTHCLFSFLSRRKSGILKHSAYTNNWKPRQKCSDQQAKPCRPIPGDISWYLAELIILLHCYIIQILGHLLHFLFFFFFFQLLLLLLSPVLSMIQEALTILKPPHWGCIQIWFALTGSITLTSRAMSQSRIVLCEHICLCYSRIYFSLEKSYLTINLILLESAKIVYYITEK